MKINEETNIRKWYESEYPSDAWCEEINPHSTFGELRNTPYTAEAVMNCLGTLDTIVRERCYEALNAMLLEKGEIKQNTYQFTVHANAFMVMDVKADSPEEARRIAEKMVSDRFFVEDHLGQFIIDNDAVIRN